MTKAEKTTQASDRATRFVTELFRRKMTDHGLRARLRRGQSPAQAHMVLADLAPYVSLTWVPGRTAYMLVGSSIAWEESAVSGSDGLGKCLRACAEGGDAENSPMTARLRRLLACRTTEEACRVLRPMLSLIRTRCPGRLDYVRLLLDLVFFESNQDRVKAGWVCDFYRIKKEEIEQ